jgi:hypothetical protein
MYRARRGILLKGASRKLFVMSDQPEPKVLGCGARESASSPNLGRPSVPQKTQT